NKCIPVANSSLAIAHGDPASLKPTVYGVEPTETILKIEWPARRYRVAKKFDSTSEIARVNNVVHPPLAYLLRRLAEILQEWRIEDFRYAIRRKAGKKARHVVQERARIEFSRLQCLLGSLAVLNFECRHIPTVDLPRVIKHRFVA